MRLLQSGTVFKQRNNLKVSSNLNFWMKFFATPNSQNITAALRLVAIEKSELILLYYTSMIDLNVGSTCSSCKNEIK